MSRFRSSMVLLGICVVALGIGVVRVATQRAPLPTGSSYSPDADGALALYAWIEAVGGSSRRLQSSFIRDDQAPATLFVLQPESMFDREIGDEFDVVTKHGGTLVVAGDSPGWLLYTRSLGVRVEAIQNSRWTATSPDKSLAVPLGARWRLKADGATPLLTTPDGDWLALRMPYEQGSLVVISSPDPLLNGALRNEPTARFVYREIVTPATKGTVAFDEAHHSYAPSTASSAPVTVNALLVSTPPGRAILYAAALTFFFLLLSSRRLGPPLPARPPTETRRTMLEHVQMLANLYRRAGQFSVVRETFSRHYARTLARGAGPPRRTAAVAEALVRIEHARTESDLISAVASASDTH